MELAWCVVGCVNEMGRRRALVKKIHGFPLRRASGFQFHAQGIIAPNAGRSERDVDSPSSGKPNIQSRALHAHARSRLVYTGGRQAYLYDERKKRLKKQIGKS